MNLHSEVQVGFRIAEDPKGEEIERLITTSGLSITKQRMIRRAMELKFPSTNGYFNRYSPLRKVEFLIETFADGSCAWIAPTGRTFTFGYAMHERVAELILGKFVADIEETHARVSHGATVRGSLEYVKRPTEKQREAVIAFMSLHPTRYSHSLEHC